LGAADAAHADGATAPTSLSGGSPPSQKRPKGHLAETPEGSSGGAKSKISPRKNLGYSKGQHFANKKLQDALGVEIVLAANDPKDVDHFSAVELCRKKAKELNIGWKPFSTEQISNLKKMVTA
jgi:hypothetical protein